MSSTAAARAESDRLEYPRCRHEFFVAFSCRARTTVCPSCSGRRMAASSVHLTDRVLPDAPVRQYVLSAPYELRLLLASGETSNQETSNTELERRTSGSGHSSFSFRLWGDGQSPVEVRLEGAWAARLRRCERARGEVARGPQAVARAARLHARAAPMRRLVRGPLDRSPPLRQLPAVVLEEPGLHRRRVPIATCSIPRARSWWKRPASSASKKRCASTIRR